MIQKCGNCANRPCGFFRDNDHGACERWFGRGSVEQLREALRQAQHDLDTSEGLWCTDIKKDGKALPNGFQLHHKSKGRVDEALEAPVDEGSCKQCGRYLCDCG